MKRILVALAAFAPAVALAQDPQPSFNDHALGQYEAPARGAPSGRVEMPQPSFVDYVELRDAALTPVAVGAATTHAAVPQPSFNG